MAEVCKRVLYSGHVQGVGFRYAARQVAADHAVTGYVRNLPTGEVELVAQGAAEAVAAFLADVATRMGRNIRGSRTADVPPEAFAGFEIRV